MPSILVPSKPRTISFIDGQNLFYATKICFGYTYPNYDPLKLSQAVCQEQNWNLVRTQFYTGVPSLIDDPDWNRFWTSKLAFMGTRGMGAGA